MYMSLDLKRRLEVDLPGMASNWKIEVSPLEQFDAFMEGYASGEHLVYLQDLSPIRHIGGGVWELKTADLRLFGWFWQRDCFIGHRIDHAQHVKNYSLYRGYASEVVRYRDGIDLDEPKFIAGDDPNDVVSNCYFA